MVAKVEKVENALSLSPPRPWHLPTQGLAIFHGSGTVARLSHYFLPRLLLQGKRVLFLDGANCADPRLLERLARQRGVPFAQFNQQIEIARAFTCFQLTELVARVPKFLEDFPAQVLIVTAFPDLYFDEDVRDWDARVAFEQALANLRRLAGHSPSAASYLAPADLKVGATQRASLPLAVAAFSAAATFMPSPTRRRFFERACAAAEVWEFSRGEDQRLELNCTRALPRFDARGASSWCSRIRAQTGGPRTPYQREVPYGPDGCNFPRTD